MQKNTLIKYESAIYFFLQIKIENKYNSLLNVGKSLTFCSKGGQESLCKFLSHYPPN